MYKTDKPKPNQMKALQNDQPFGTLKALATQKLAKLAGKTFINVVPSAEDVTENGEKAYLFSAAPADDPNGASFSVALTASGRELKPAEIAKLFIRDSLELKPDLLISAVAGKDPITISPTENDLVLNECDRFDEVITVTVPKNPNRKVDVYFLADTTGSMGSILAAVKAGATTILNTSYGAADIAFGVGQYKDFLSGDPFCFQNQLSPTTSKPAAAAAINSWVASGGADNDEGQLFALDQLGTLGGIWRSGAKRIIVWFGDQPGHEPICSSVSGLGYSLTRTNVAQKLALQQISLLAISVGASNNLDGVPNDNYTGCIGTHQQFQASQMTSMIGLGSTFTAGINTTNIVNTIINLINAAVAVINNVKLVPTGCVGAFATSIEPAAGYGPLSGDKEHILKFKVSFTGTRPCDDKDFNCNGSLDVVADGVVVAAKKVHIRVPACCRRRFYSYNVKFVIGRKEKEECNTKNTVNPGLYATEINILNYSGKKAIVRKHVIPLVEDAKVIGREPKFSKVTANDSIILDPMSATMDDAYRLSELLFGTPVCNIGLTIGFLVIVSNIPLTVSAVYTASTLDGELASIEIEDIEGREIPVPVLRTGGLVADDLVSEE